MCMAEESLHVQRFKIFGTKREIVTASPGQGQKRAKRQREMVVVEGDGQSTAAMLRRSVISTTISRQSDSLGNPTS